MNKKIGIFKFGAVLLASFAINIQAAKPTIIISASPATIIVGSSSTLTWTTTGATSASINRGIGSVPVNGSMAIVPIITTTYTIKVKNSSGIATAKATVTVVVSPPTVSFSAAPDTIPPKGPATLSWITSGAKLVSINNGIGTVALNGSKVVKPSITKIYTITVKGSGGTVTAKATVTVVVPPPTVSFRAAPAIIEPGQSSKLTWSVQNATSISIDNGIGTIALNGSKTVTPSQSITYTLTAQGTGGTTTSQTTITVAQPPTVTFSAAPMSIKSGESATLTWTSTNANTVVIDNGIGNVALIGSLTVNPTQDTIYTMIATGTGGNVTATAVVYINDGHKVYAYVPNYLEKTIKVFDTANNSQIATFDLWTPEDIAGCVTFSPFGDRVYYSNKAQGGVWEIDPGFNDLSDAYYFNFGPSFITISPNGRFLYAGCGASPYDTLPNKDKTIVGVYDLRDKKIVRQVRVARKVQTDFSLSPDGSTLYVVADGILQAFDTEKLRIPQVLNPNDSFVDLTDELKWEIPQCPAIAVHPDGNRVFVAGNPIKVIDVSTQTVMKTLDISGDVLKLYLSPNGERLFVKQYAPDLLYTSFNLSTWVKQGEFKDDNIYGFGLSPEGKRIYLLRNGMSSNLKVVDAATMQLLTWVTLEPKVATNGNFVGQITDTISGRVTMNEGDGVGNVQVHLTGSDVNYSIVNHYDGSFCTAVRNGNYTVSVEKAGYTFTPQQQEVNVTAGSVTDVNFEGHTEVPELQVWAIPERIEKYEVATLFWEIKNYVDGLWIDGYWEGQIPSGKRDVQLDETRTYHFYTSGPGGSANADVTVYVGSLPAPTVTISAMPATIQVGGSSTLTWTSTNATSASIDNGIGTVPVNGSSIVTPAATTSYKITVTGPGGSNTAQATVTVSQYDTSAVLTGTVSDLALNLPLAGVTVSAVDASGVPKTASTNASGKYTITNLRVGNISVSFAKSGYDPYQQTINIPANTTIDLTTQLHLTQVGATLHGLVKDGQTNQPISGATVTAIFTGGSLSATSDSDGAYALVGIPLNTLVKITASATDYRDIIINQTFTMNVGFVYDFVLFNTSALATVNGKITNSKTLLPEAGVKVIHEGSNISKTTAADGTFIFENIPFGEQTYYFEKTDFIEETYTCTIDNTPFTIDLIKPSREGGQISIGQSISGVIQDAVSQRPLSGAIVRVPGLGLEAETDVNGNYQFTGLPVGNYPMMVIATNYMALNFMASVDIDETNRADFALIPLANGLIKGTVTDAATGEPVAEASIEIEGSAMLAAASEGDGTYKMVGVPPGIYKVLVMHAEYADALVENVEVRDLSPTTVDLQLGKRPVTGALEGRILDNVTGNPVGGATVTVSGTLITATTDAGGNYRLANVMAGLNDIIVAAPDYPESPRIRAVIADKDLSSPLTTSSDIRIDVNNSTVNEAVTAIITANEGGDIITQDSRFLLHIFPGTLSADARITLKDASDGPDAPIGSDLPLDPALGIEEIKAASIMTQIEIAPVNAGDPTPIVNGLAVFATRYAQKDNDTFQLDENTAFTYFWNGSYFSALNPRPYELAVDKINNIVYSVMDFSKTITGSTAQHSKKTLLTADPAKSGAVKAFATTIIIKIIGKSIKNTINPPKPNVKIFDKNELNAVTTAPFKNIPNPNALPLLVIHGFDPSSFILGKETNPNKEERYRLMLEDIVDATNGVYRPVFVSYNTEAKISSIAQSLAEKLFGEFQNLNISFKGLPANPNDPASGTFPYLDTFGFSMGGLVSRTFIFFNKINRVHNMTIIGTPNHGTFNCLKYLFSNNSLFGVASNIVKPLNFGASDMLDYDDNNPIDGYNQNPFLFRLNSPILSPAVTPRGDMNLFAGTDESAWRGLTNLFIASPHDSLVTVKSVYCRPANSTLESKLSLLKVHKPLSEKYERTKNFSHANIGTKDKRINEFSEELAKGFSDWTVERVYDENSMDNAFIKPTKDVGGYCKSKVKVEYNVWVPDAERQARDFDRVVLVIYHKDGNDHWHISEPKGGENGANVNGNVVGAKVKSISGNSKFTQASNPLILDATVNFDPNPTKGEIGYDPEKDIVDTVSLVIPLKPGKMTIPLDPTKAHFRTPNLND